MLKKIFNFLRTHSINRFLPEYFYLLFIHKGEDTVKKLMELRVRELGGKDAESF